MAEEIERKFLVENDSWRNDVFRQTSMRQGYLNNAEKSSIRVRVTGEKAYLNIKSATLGIYRKEYEYEIPMEDGNEILNTLAQGPLIEKVRYYVKHGRHVWEVDVFEGENEGLIVAEVELSHEDEEYKKPDWAGEEVSGDTRYYNVCLVKHPFKQWPSK